MNEIYHFVHFLTHCVFSLTVFCPLLLMWSCQIKVIHGLNQDKLGLPFILTSKSREQFTLKWKFIYSDIYSPYSFPNLYDWHAFVENKRTFEGEWQKSVTNHFHCARFARNEREWWLGLSIWHLLYAKK